jgi:hypothetical protein
MAFLNYVRSFTLLMVGLAILQLIWVNYSHTIGTLDNLPVIETHEEATESRNFIQARSGMPLSIRADSMEAVTRLIDSHKNYFATQSGRFSGAFFFSFNRYSSKTDDYDCSVSDLCAALGEMGLQELKLENGSPRALTLKANTLRWQAGSAVSPVSATASLSSWLGVDYFDGMPFLTGAEQLLGDAYKLCNSSLGPAACDFIQPAYVLPDHADEFRAQAPPGSMWFVSVKERQRWTAATIAT